jgi:hypothetical protein
LLQIKGPRALPSEDKKFHMITLINGALSLGRQNGGHQFADWNFGNYDLTLTDPATLYGTTVLDHSDLTISGGPLDNNGTLIAEDGSELVVQNNLTGSGTIVSVDSSVLIAGGAPTSETIDLLDHSQLYLGSIYGIPGFPNSLSFLAPIDMDSTSTIHFYNPATWADVGSNEAVLLSSTVPDLVNLLAVVHSLTPGYAPQAELQFAPNSPAIIGLTIVDKPIIAAHT